MGELRHSVTYSGSGREFGSQQKANPGLQDGQASPLTTGPFFVPLHSVIAIPAHAGPVPWPPRGLQSPGPASELPSATLHSHVVLKEEICPREPNPSRLGDFQARQLGISPSAAAGAARAQGPPQPCTHVLPGQKRNCYNKFHLLAKRARTQEE